MKKIRIVLFSVLLGLMLCACGSDEGQSVSALKEKLTAQLMNQENLDLQDIRLYGAGSMANSYVIDSLEHLAQQPEYYGAHYTEFTYDEMETLVSQEEGFLCDGYAYVSAVENFEKGLAETGAILGKGDPIVKRDGSEIIVDVECVCERRNADIELIFTYDLNDPVLKSAAFNPRYTMNEKMSKAGLNTLIGMGTVFAMLIVIAIIIGLFGVFSGVKKPGKTEEGINRAVKQIEKNETEGLESDSELVAVIAAAVAAYEGTSSAGGFTVRSIKKIKRQ